MNTSLSGQHVARLAAAMASLGAGVIHIAVVPDHLATWWASGLFFIVLAIFQLVWAAVVAVSESRVVLAMGGVVSVGSIVLWTVTRVWGQPVGPQAGTPLPVGPAGLIAGVLELALIGCVWWALRARTSRHLRGVAAVTSLGTAFAAALALTVPGVSAALEHDHAAHAEQGDHDHGHENSKGGHHNEPGAARAGHDDRSGPTPEKTPPRPAAGDEDQRPSPSPTPEQSKSPTNPGHGHGGHSH